MAIEIERKFLVRGDGWKAAADGGCVFRQAYLATGDKLSVRVRLINDAAGKLTLKAAHGGLSRQEFEYGIPAMDAREMIELRSGNLIEKTRYRIPVGELTWEVDVFKGANAGLVLAEIELQREDQVFNKPVWIGAEVTGDKRYYSASLARYPISQW